jgi:hypothetical protein
MDFLTFLISRSTPACHPLRSGLFPGEILEHSPERFHFETGAEYFLTPITLENVGFFMRAEFHSAVEVSPKPVGWDVLPKIQKRVEHPDESLLNAGTV